MAPPAHFTVELRWADFDSYGHLHAAAHVTVYEHARAQFYDALLGGHETWDYAVVHPACDARGLARRAGRPYRLRRGSRGR